MLDQKGFTLIELLVTLIIVAILGTIGLISFREVVQGGRDGKRQGDLKVLQSYLEQYRADLGFYPTSAGMNAILGSGASFTSSIGNPSPLPSVKSYINNTPKDPLDSGNNKYCYEALPNTPSACDNGTTKCTQGYRIYAKLEKQPNGTYACGGVSVYNLYVGPP